MKISKINPISKEDLEKAGFSWHTDTDGSSYIDDEIISISEAEANAYYEACNELYDMYVAAAEYVIENELLSEIGIPFNLHQIVKDSFENDVHWHIYGRFDLAGGLDGKPIKLIEFNADTPTSLFESSFLQWLLLEKNGINSDKQFNDIYDALVDNFKRLVVLDGDLDEFKKYYEGWKILFSSISGNDEEEITTKFLQSAADEAGFKTAFEYIENVSFSEDGVFIGDENYEYFFKLIPWESIAIEESELAMLLTKIVQNQKAIILNPAYTLIFQSKKILSILWKLYPNHPLLLETKNSPLNKNQVKKPTFGREGANVEVLDSELNILDSKDGEYINNGFVYQEYVDFLEHNGYKYQAGVFFAYEACGLGFRKAKGIIDNMSKFVAHKIEN